MALFSEHCWLVYGVCIGDITLGWLRYHSKGGPSSVDFDWEVILNPRVIGCFHSHPGDLLRPSEKDHKTARSWVWASGRPMICGIKCGGQHACFTFYRWSSASIGFSEVNGFLAGPLFFGIRSPIMKISMGASTKA